jgi:hypothetical protein
MRKGITYVDLAEFEQIIADVGCPATTMAGFIKCRGAKGLNVYVARSAKVARVDISGFKIQDERVLTLGEGSRFGAVTQQLDFTRTKEEILDTFRRALITMATLPPREEKRQNVKKQIAKADIEARKLAKAARLVLIKKVAQEKGVAISSKVDDDGGQE